MQFGGTARSGLCYANALAALSPLCLNITLAKTAINTAATRLFVHTVVYFLFKFKWNKLTGISVVC